MTIPFWLYAGMVLVLCGALFVVVCQRNTARQQVDDLLAGVCTCSSPGVPCPSHRGARRHGPVDK